MAEQLISVISDFLRYAGEYLHKEFFPRVFDVVDAPFKIHNMLWMLLPLLATLLLMEFYFGRYKEEELGWNTAFGNALVLIFVSIDLFRNIYEPIGGSIAAFVFSGPEKIIIPLCIAAFGVILLLINFFHFLPAKIAYILSSPIYINIISLFGIIIAYSADIPLDWTTLFACWTLFILINILAQMIYYIVPQYHSPLQRILTVEDVEAYQKKTNTKNNVKK